MTLVPAACHSPAAPRTAAAEEPAGQSGSGGFAEVLGDRRALTDSRSDHSSRGAAAPMAVSFDRGDLFGKAVSFTHDVAPAAPPADEGRRSLPTVSPMRAVADNAGLGSEPGHDTPNAAEQVGRGEVRGAGPKGAAIAMPFDRSAALARPLVAQAEADGLTVASARGQNTSRSSAEREAQRAVRGGQAQRREAVMQLGPVSVVARATPGGIEVAARIGGRSRVDDAELEGAIRAAIESDGETLDGLIVEGRRIGGNRQCQ